MQTREEGVVKRVTLPPTPRAVIDAGIANLYARAVPGKCYTQDEIAEACGVRRQTIWQIEFKAMRKLRRRYLQAMGLPGHAHVSFEEVL
jgi:DNA-directed RNA polymerase sigma subunit (sigma70/sigma32)